MDASCTLNDVIYIGVLVNHYWLHTRLGDLGTLHEHILEILLSHLLLKLILG